MNAIARIHASIRYGNPHQPRKAPLPADDGSDVCRCGAVVKLSENQLRKGARLLGCKACNWSGK